MKPTREEVIRVARKCGLYVGENLSGVTLVGSSYNKNCDLLIHLNIEDMERFAQHFYEAGAAAAREPLQKDAERYRWLVSSHWYVGPEPDGDLEGVSWNDHNSTAEGVTQAIDAAIAKATGEKT